MRIYSLTDKQLNQLRRDKRNDETPYKAIASGEIQPLRFATELEAFTFFHKHNGRCLLTHNTPEKVTFLAYKYD